MPKKSKLTISSIIKDRKSVRGFLNKKVPLNKIKKIFELAQHAPSNCNIQPWFSFISSQFFPYLSIRNNAMCRLREARTDMVIISYSQFIIVIH